MKLTVLPQQFAICRLSPEASIPAWALHRSGLFSVTWTEDELSIVLDAARCPEGVLSEGGWRALKVMGPLDFSLTGVLSGLTTPLAEAGVSVFAISTFDTDYLLVKRHSLEKTINTLTAQGHEVAAP